MCAVEEVVDFYKFGNPKLCCTYVVALRSYEIATRFINSRSDREDDEDSQYVSPVSHFVIGSTQSLVFSCDADYIPMYAMRHYSYQLM